MTEQYGNLSDGFFLYEREIERDVAMTEND
jgi:hypothetical protein